LSEFTINGRHLRVDDASAPKEKSSKGEERTFNKFDKGSKARLGEKRKGKW